jgi:hypothetical protein
VTLLASARRLALSRARGRLARGWLIDSPPAQGLSRSGPQVHLLRFLNLSLLSDSLLPCSSFPGGDDWASGGAICPVFAQPFAGDERILQVCPPLLFPAAVRDGAPQTLTKLFVFGCESSYNILPTDFDSFARIIGCTCVHPCPMLGPPLRLDVA